MSNEALDMFGDEVNEAEDKFFESGGQIDDDTQQVQDEGEADGQAEQQAKSEVTEAPTETPTEAPEEKPENTVPHSRFHAEMMERQRIQQEADQLRQQNAELLALKEQLNELRKGKEVEEQTSAFEEDPLGYMKEKVDSLEQQKAMAEQRQAEAMQQQQFAEQLNNWATAQVSAFSREHQDYGQAFEFVIDTRRSELRQSAEIMGIQADPAQIEAQLQQESMGLIMQAAQNNKNPAEIVYNLAKARGYAQPEQPKADDSLKQKIDKIEKGQQASSSLSGTTSAPQGELSVSDISSAED
jgi:hypothetical protein